MCQHGRRQECGRQHRGGGQEQLQDVPLPFGARHNRHGAPVGRQRRGKTYPILPSVVKPVRAAGRNRTFNIRTNLTDFKKVVYVGGKH